MSSTMCQFLEDKKKSVFTLIRSEVDPLPFAVPEERSLKVVLFEQTSIGQYHQRSARN